MSFVGSLKEEGKVRLRFFSWIGYYFSFWSIVSYLDTGCLLSEKILVLQIPAWQQYE